MKTERVEHLENEQGPVFYATLEEAANAKSERTKQALNKLNPAARARLNTSDKQSRHESPLIGRKP